MKTSGIFMRVYYIALSLLVAIAFWSCVDYYVETEITVLNNSSYDLNVVFERILPHGGFSRNIDVNQGESVSFIIFPQLGGKNIEHYNPNEGVSNVIISNLDTGEKTKELNNLSAEVTLFEFMGFMGLTAMYNFEITDDLLFQ